MRYIAKYADTFIDSNGKSRDTYANAIPGLLSSGQQTIGMDGVFEHGIFRNYILRTIKDKVEGVK